MDLRRSRTAMLAMPFALASVSGCTFPTRDPVKLRAIKHEAWVLIADHPIHPPHEWVRVPESRWPPAIKSLKPEFVTVDRSGVDILIKPYFDGGWGYRIARRRQDLGMPPGCVSELYQGVFWHGPC
jgi:hypothetical protein